jgi:hypothetical protein
MLLRTGEEHLLKLDSNSNLTTTQSTFNYCLWRRIKLYINALEFLFEDVSFLVRPTVYEQVAMQWTV